MHFHSIEQLQRQLKLERQRLEELEGRKHIAEMVMKHGTARDVVKLRNSKALKKVRGIRMLL